MSERYRFNRLEIAGSFGDLGALLPISIGMIMLNGLNPFGIFFSIGLFYILAGAYYGVTVPVQPMKVISAYALATALSPSEIAASALLMAVFLFFMGITGFITHIGKFVPKSVIRGVQLATGTLLMAGGVRFVVGTSIYQLGQGASEPYLTIQSVLSLPVGILIGAISAIITLLFLANKKAPAGIIVILFGLTTGLFLGTHEGFNTISLKFNLPEILPFGIPTSADFSLALLMLVLPQLPMTIGNAVVANADLSKQYFSNKSAKVTPKALCISMALANCLCFLIGGMPLCHGAGGLASHYAFGARTAGSNMVIGSIFILLAIFLGSHAVTFIQLIPFSVMGVLLFFAGSQLALTIMDMSDRKEFFVIFAILGITLVTNLAIAFGIGITLAYLLKSNKLTV